MRKLLVPLLLISPPLTLVHLTSSAAPPPSIVRLWIDAVLHHQPGKVDEAVNDVAAAPPETFTAIGVDLRSTLLKDFPDFEVRNNVRRRGALLHTDIALLVPGKAAAFKWRDGAPPFGPAWKWEGEGGRALAQRGPHSLVYLVDGQFVATETESAHWPLASWLLSGVEPEPSSDEFVRLWHRAVAATFLNEYRFGNAGYNLERAREVLPHDPELLFYAGTVHEGFASPRFQTARGEAPQQNRYRMIGGIMVPLSSDASVSVRGQLQSAERMYREALKNGASVETRIRLGRVLGLLGKHEGALKVLETFAPPADARLAYFHALFLGTSYLAVGRPAAARTSFERAATLFPTAQTPLVAIGDVCRRSGDRAGAVAALGRLAALPHDISARTDPWWDYYRSPAADAEEQLRAVRAWVDLHGVR